MSVTSIRRPWGRLHLVSSTAAVSLLLGVATSASAQDSKETTVGEVIVVAQKRSENLQDVPVSVSAVSGETLQAANVQTLEDLSASVPGFVVAASVNYGSAPLSIRGVGGANGGGNVFADEPVSIYVDDAVVGRLRMSTSDLVDVGSVEVLRGPQGTLYGRNSTAGAVLVRSATPTNDLTGYLRLTAASYGQFKAAAAVSGPVLGSEILTGRLAVNYSTSDGWATNAGGGKLGGSENFTGRLYLRLAPSSALTIDLIGEYIENEVHPAIIAVSDVSSFSGAAPYLVRPYTPRPGLAQLLEDNRFGLNFPTFTETSGHNLTLKVDYDLTDGVTLYSITNFRDWRQTGSQDSDGTAIDPPLPSPFVIGDISNFGDNDGRFYDAQWSQELRLGNAGDARFNWIVGGYFYWEKNKISPIQIRNRLAGPGSPSGVGALVTFDATQVAQSWALFADANYDITDRLSLTVGARYSHEEKEFADRQTVKTINTFDPPGPTFIPGGTTLVALSVSNQESWSNVSPRAVLNYRFNDDVMGYVSYSEGFKSGGFNAFNASPASTSFDPENIKAWEVGLKSDLFDGAVRLNLAAFNYSYSNLQVRVPVPTGGVGIETADEATSRGIEAEGSWIVTPAFRIDANLSYLDAQFEKGSVSSVQVASFNFGSNPAVVAEDISGNRLSRAPEWQGYVSGRYKWETALGEVTAQASYRYQGSVFFLETQQNQSTYKEGDWSQVDARLGLESADGRWEAAVFGTNLTDDRHLSQITAFFALPNASVNDPRMVGVQFNLRY